MAASLLSSREPCIAIHCQRACKGAKFHRCVPKKMTWNFASVSEMLKDGVHYGYNIPQNIPFDFPQFKKNRDAKIQGLNAAYERNWGKENIELVRGTAGFKSATEIEVELADGGKAVYTAPKILIATGGHPIKPEGIPGAEYGIVGRFLSVYCPIDNANSET